MFNNDCLVSEISERLERDERLIVRTFNLIAESLVEARDAKFNEDFDHHIDFLNKILDRRNYDLDEIEEFLMESDFHKGISIFSLEKILRVDLTRYQESRKQVLDFPENDNGAVKLVVVDRK